MGAETARLRSCLWARRHICIVENERRVCMAVVHSVAGRRRWNVVLTAARPARPRKKHSAASSGLCTLGHAPELADEPSGARPSPGRARPRSHLTATGDRGRLGTRRSRPIRSAAHPRALSRAAGAVRRRTRPAGEPGPKPTLSHPPRGAPLQGGSARRVLGLSDRGVFHARRRRGSSTFFRREAGPFARLPGARGAVGSESSPLRRRSPRRTWRSRRWRSDR